MAQTASLTSAMRDRGGAAGVVLALFLTVSVGFSALAVDVGSLYLERRTMQGAADLAAIAAASDLAHAEAAARATLVANGFASLRTLSVVKGRYTADRSAASGQRFKAGAEPFNAVRVEAAGEGQLYFAKSFLRAPEISVSAMGTADVVANFSIGSRLASVNGGLTNALLGALLGGHVALSALDYQALARADISLAGFVSALATEIGLAAGTFGDVAAAEVGVGSALRAAAETARAEGDTAAGLALAALARASAASARVPLGALLDLGPLAQADIGQPAAAALAANLNVLGLVTSAAALGNGARQVAVDLGAAVPGLLGLRLDLAIGEPAQHSGWAAVGHRGARVETAQVRLRLVAEVGGSGLLAGVRVRLPLYIELARAEGELRDITCPPAGSGGEVVVAARPAVVRAWIGDVPTGGLASFGSSVPVSRGSIVQTPLIQVGASAYTEMSNAAATELRFSRSDIDGHVIKTAEVGNFAGSLVGSLLQSADLQVNVLGLGLSVSAIRGLVLASLSPVTSALDALLGPLLALAGVHLGEVDVQVNGLNCRGAVLAG